MSHERHRRDGRHHDASRSPRDHDERRSPRHHGDDQYRSPRRHSGDEHRSRDRNRYTRTKPREHDRSTYVRRRPKDRYRALPSDDRRSPKQEFPDKRRDRSPYTRHRPTADRRHSPPREERPPKQVSPDHCLPISTAPGYRSPKSIPTGHRTLPKLSAEISIKSPSARLTATTTMKAAQPGLVLVSGYENCGPWLKAGTDTSTEHNYSNVKSVHKYSNVQFQKSVQQYENVVFPKASASPKVVVVTTTKPKSLALESVAVVEKADSNMLSVAPTMKAPVPVIVEQQPDSDGYEVPLVLQAAQQAKMDATKRTKRRRRICICCIVMAIVIVLVTVAIVVGVYVASGKIRI